MDVTTQIIQVTVRNTKTGKTVYDVACGDGLKRQVWDAALANAINAQTGQTVTFRVDVQQNGKYTNHSIQAFAPAGQQLPPDTNGVAAPMGGQPLGAAPIAAAPAILPSPSGGGSDGAWTPETTVRVTKLACISDACVLVAGLFAGAGPEALDEALAAVTKAAKQFYTAARAHEQAAASGALVVTTTAQGGVAAVVPATAEQVAATVPGVVVGTSALANDPLADLALPVDAPVAEANGADISWD